MINKIQSNTNFRLRYLRTWLSWNLLIYLIIVPVVFYILIQTGFVGTSRGSLVYRIWALIVYQFIVSAKFQEDFDYFLTFSNTRKEIFYSLGTAAVVNSIFISLIIVLEKVMIDFLNVQFGYRNIIDPFHSICTVCSRQHICSFLLFPDFVYCTLFFRHIVRLFVLPAW